MKKIVLICVCLFPLIFFSCNVHDLGDELCDCADSQVGYLADTVDVSVPNILTPNGDGINDALRIITYPTTTTTIKIYRDNNLVFETSANATVWSPSTDSNVDPEGKYTYELTVNNQTFIGLVCLYRGEGQISGQNCFSGLCPSDIGDPVLYHK